MAALRLPVAAAACALLIVLGLFTAERNAVYRSEIRLWEDTAAKSPGKARVFNNLGYAYFLAGATMRPGRPGSRRSASTRPTSLPATTSPCWM